MQPQPHPTATPAPRRRPALGDRHNLAYVFVRAFPTIPLLPRADKDPLAGLGFTIPLDVLLGDIAHTSLRGWQQTQVGRFSAFSPARAARRRAQHHDVLRHRPGNPQLEPQSPLAFADNQLLNQVRPEHYRLGWPPQQFMPVSPPRAVYPGEMHFSRKGTRWAQSGTAHDLRPRHPPGPPFFLRQQIAPGFGDGGHNLPRQPLRRRARIMWDDVPA